MCDPARHP
ncbi:unnamed protein product [Linum tenue]|uniref:Uncharacterized protein n=1 Tax=Linum tenue TaxID=586396 RepID=A0AAV0L7J0_9ROSI|nr:unnamed protein product [Linum tenue]CAI0430437.1 unnamed protein product [Linum tenue]CAI0430515.1 unnamed protein product [Linum tenue]